MKRRRVSSDEDHMVDSCIGDLKNEREASTPTSTSDNETRDSSIIDPGTEQDPPSPSPLSTKEYRIEVSSSFTEDILLPARPQPTEDQPGNSVKYEDGKEMKELQSPKETNVMEEDSELPSTSISAVLADLADLRGCDGQPSPTQDSQELSLSINCEHSRGLFSHIQQNDILDTLCRTIESTILVVSRISGKENKAAS